jgi:hypothetical protein
MGQNNRYLFLTFEIPYFKSSKIRNYKIKKWSRFYGKIVNQRYGKKISCLPIARSRLTNKCFENKSQTRNRGTGNLISYNCGSRV